MNLHVSFARRWHQRLLGLMFRSSLPLGEGLMLSPCVSVHTAFMRFPIDVVYLDAEWRLLTVREALAPWRMSWGPRGTCHTLELPAGGAALLGCQVGDGLKDLLLNRNK